MKKVISILSIILAAVILLPNAALAAKPENAGNSKPKPTEPAPTPVEYLGYDVSYPQCGKNVLNKLPTDHHFAVIGVNGGTAASENPCLTDQLAWAKKAKTGFEQHQDRIQLYVNTGNPAQESVYDWKTWPTSGINPYGACEGAKNNSLACSWQYGWNRSAATEAYFVTKARSAGISTNTQDYIWWLDVETMNSWQSGSSESLAKNRASIEGFAAYYQAKGADVGLYSTKIQWEQIVGDTLIADGNLTNLPNWRPSGASLANAKENCSVAPLTAGGFISLTQYIIKSLDHNHSCI